MTVAATEVARFGAERSPTSRSDGLLPQPSTARRAPFAARLLFGTDCERLDWTCVPVSTRAKWSTTSWRDRRDRRPYRRPCERARRSGRGARVTDGEGPRYGLGPHVRRARLSHAEGRSRPVGDPRSSRVTWRLRRPSGRRFGHSGRAAAGIPPLPRRLGVPWRRGVATSGSQPPCSLVARSPRLRPRPAPRRARHAWSLLASLVFVGDQQLAIDSVEQEVGVAAREEPSRRRGEGSPEARLVAGQDPPIADRRLHGHDFPGERIDIRGPQQPPIPAHLVKAAAVVGPKTCRYLRASSSRASPGSISGRGTVQITGSRAPPTDQDGACRCGIPVHWDGLRPLGPPRRISSAGRRGTRAGERCPRRGAGPSRRPGADRA